MASVLRGTVVEEEIELTLVELCQACGAEREQVLGVVEVVADRHHRGAGGDDLLRQRGVLARLA